MTEIPEIEPPKQRRFIKQPDIEQKNKKIQQLNDEIKKIESSVTLISSQIDSTTTPKADSEKRKELTNELRKIISSQDEIKRKRHDINDQIRLIDSSIKKKINEITSKTSKYNFKNVDEIDNKIKKLENSIESGNLMLVEEKKALKEITTLNKLKKDFAGIEIIQKSIDSDKVKIQDLKNSLSNVSNKEIQTKFETITKELDDLSNKNKDIQSKRDELFNKRRTLNNEKYEKLKEIRKIRDDFDAKFKKFKADMDNERKKREEEEKAYRLSLERKDLLNEIKDLENSVQGLSDSEEVNSIKAIILSLNPNYKFDDEKSNLLDSLDNSSIDKVTKKVNEISLPEDAELITKKEEEFFAPTSTKSKKGKKNNNKKKQIVDAHTLTQLNIIGVTLPSSEEDIPKIIEELETKLSESKTKAIEANKKQHAEAEAKIAQIKEQIAELEKQILAELAKEKERLAAAKESAAVVADAEKEDKEDKEDKEESA